MGTELDFVSHPPLRLHVSQFFFNRMRVKVAFPGLAWESLPHVPLHAPSPFGCGHLG